MRKGATPSSSRYLLDTNVLLRRAYSKSPLHQDVTLAVSKLLAEGAIVCVTAQNIIEFWNVATRPEINNGIGWSTAQTASELAKLKTQFTFLPDKATIFGHWERLVSTYGVQGVQVHDARLYAVALTYRVGNILTFNGKDFRRFASEGVNAIAPTTLLSAGAPKK